MVYLFDRSLEGLLTSVFEWFERRPGKVTLMPDVGHQPDAFMAFLTIQTSREKADRVLKGLLKRLDRAWLRKLYCCYLSETPEAFNHIFQFCCYVFKNHVGAEKNYGDPHVLAISKYAKSVEREKHRMEAFIRFKETKDRVFYCSIDPDFNVLPLISKHFKDRYGDQQWLIYDHRRRYGLYYNLKTVEEINMDFNNKLSSGSAVSFMDPKEVFYSTLWKDYFKSTNIISRKNTKLHTKHVPKRYWRYLTEKES
ncbi:TIGR03915 family putative DNA repair protein [Pedobacter insulae]|uniref:Probable DNA metabolism protein n=1 Tax=Pedobacter insulae TaxID=414048 RepID=A0A1I2YV91_9SPHI|nr:TIGR03915 family putative DNA repair protein [Pedobacter insulae]SFH29380.1 probable DNA metabolism protein [Pedobacter insulae]